MSRLDEIAARLKAATPGPWRLDDAQREVQAMKVKTVCEVPCGGVMSTGVDKANARMIAAAPEDTAWLVSRVRALEAALERVLADVPHDGLDDWEHVVRAALAGGEPVSETSVTEKPSAPA